MLVVLFTVSVLFALRLIGVIDTDLWWHMAVGRWIVDRRAIPHSEPFSGFGAGKPFEAYSWLFELIVFWIFKKLGLMGIMAFTSAMAASITAAVHHLVRRLNSMFLLGVGITFLSIFTMGRLYTPRPWLPSMLFFALELDILMRVRKTGESRELYWLPVIFAVWVNMHIQFVDGLVVLGIALIEALAAARWTKIQTNFRARKMAFIFLGCIAATLFNPYGLKIYKVAYDLVEQGAGLAQLPELTAIPFRSLDDWCVLLIALSAAIALARSSRHSFFEVALLAFSIVVSFRSQRDIWVLAIAGAGILASNLRERQTDQILLTASASPVIAVATAAFAALSFLLYGVNDSELETKLANSMPVRAVEKIQQQAWSGPLYNDYGWGGYLIWTLQQPVSIYGRNTVYGVEKVLRSNATWNASAGWDSDPDLVRSNLIVAKAGAPLVQLLRLQPCLETAYQDNVTVLFIPRGSSSGDGSLRSTTFCSARETAENSGQ